MVQWVQTALVSMALAAVMLAGCLGSDAASDVESYRDPSWRVRDVTQDSYVSKDCPVEQPGLDRWDCFDHSIKFHDLRCDPTQNVLVDLGLSDHEKGSDWEGPGDRYVFCEYSIGWELTAYSMVPDTQVYAGVDLGNQRFVERCSMGRDGSCTVDGELEGTIEFDGPRDDHRLTVELKGIFTGMGRQGLLPVDTNHGLLNAQEEMRIFT